MSIVSDSPSNGDNQDHFDLILENKYANYFAGYGVVSTYYTYESWATRRELVYRIITGCMSSVVFSSAEVCT